MTTNTENKTEQLVNGKLTEVKDNEKVVKSAMDGKDVVIEKDTPYCCDPSFERYWSM